MDAAVHDGLDEGTDVLVLNCAFAVPRVKASPVRAEGHGLVLMGSAIRAAVTGPNSCAAACPGGEGRCAQQYLEVTLASLVADGAVQRVVDEEEFHHALAVGAQATSARNRHAKTGPMK